MSRVIYDTFTTGSDTALGSHTPDERPGSEAWTVSNGSITVVATGDVAAVTTTGLHRAGINRAINGDWDIYGDLSNLSGSTGTVAFPALHGFLSTGYDDGECLYFQYSVSDQRYVLGRISTTDGEAFDTHTTGTPGGAVTLRMERSGNTINGYAGGVLKCTISCTGTTDFATPATFYPGFSSNTTSAVRPHWDNFEVYQDGYITATLATKTIATFAATITTTGNVNVSATTATLTITANAATVTFGRAVSATSVALTITTYSATVVTGVSLDPLTIASTTTKVAVNGFARIAEARAPEIVLGADGGILSGVVSSRTHRNVYEIVTPPLLATNAATLVGVLTSGVALTVSGTLFSSGFTAYAGELEMDFTEGGLYRVLSFSLYESAT